MPIFRPAATDEFWCSPALAHAVPPSRDDDAGNAVAAVGDGAGDGDCDDDSFMEAVVIPPAHRQLLSSDTKENQKEQGYDLLDRMHQCNARLRDQLGDLDWRADAIDDFDEYNDLDRSIEMRAAASRWGGGSWLLDSPMRDPEADLPSAESAEVLRLLAQTVSRQNAMPGLASASDEDSSAASSGADDASLPSRGRRGVSFAPTVAVRLIPHSSELSLSQKRRMFATAAEVRRNKARNRKEFLWDGGDWWAATEEADMAVDAVTGETVHPAHCGEYAGFIKYPEKDS